MAKFFLLVDYAKEVYLSEFHPILLFIILNKFIFFILFIKMISHYDFSTFTDFVNKFNSQLKDMCKYT